MLGVWCTDILQAHVYDVLPLEEGAGKRCSEWSAGTYSKHTFTTSFLWRKVPESDARVWCEDRVPGPELAWKCVWLGALLQSMLLLLHPGVPGRQSRYTEVGIPCRVTVFEVLCE